MMGVMTADKACQLPIDQLAEELWAEIPTGLAQVEVDRKLKSFGYNDFTVKDEESMVYKYLGQFKDPLILLLLASAFISVLLRQFDDAISIACAIVIVVTVAFIQEYRSEKSLEALTKLVPPRCNCMREGKLVNFLARELVPGDIVHLNVGDRVPADLRIYEAIDMEIDESSFTGETQPVRKTHQTLTFASGESITIPDKKNLAFMGTLVRCGHGKGIVIGTGENSEFGEIFKMMQDQERPKTPLQKSMDILGKQLSLISFAIIGGIMLIGIVQGRPILDMFTIGVSLAVAAIPEGLPIVVTVTLALGVMRMAQRKAIIKKLPTVETLGCVDVICTDKTGTLTQNEMTVTQVYTTDGRIAEVTGAGYNARGEVLYNPKEVALPYSHPILTKLAQVGSVCNNALIVDENLRGSPTEGALLSFAMKMGVFNARHQFRRIQEWAFSSETKYMMVKCEFRGGSELVSVSSPSVSAAAIDEDISQGEELFFLKGAWEQVLDLCQYTYHTPTSVPLFHESQSDAQCDQVPLTDSKKKEIATLAVTWGNGGLRVLALAFGRKTDALQLVGLVGIMDPPRIGVRESIASLRYAGVDIKMVTGDSEETAVGIGQRLGIHDSSCSTISGSQLEKMDIDRLADELPRVSIVYRATPKHKLKLTQALQLRRRIAGMTGDGVNDAVALRGADIGIAMGKSGTDVSKEAADMILTEDDFSTILSAIEEGKCIFHNIRNFVTFQLSTSIAALSLIAFSTLLKLPNPLNAMQILWINIIMDGPPAQSLGVEPVDPDVIRQPPRKVEEPIINRKLIATTLLSALIIVTGTLWIFWRELSYDGKVTPRDTTMTFTCFVFFDMFNALAARSQTKSVFVIGFFTNKVFLAAVGGSIFGQFLVVYFPFLQDIFQTEALYFSDIVVLVSLTSSVFWIQEVRKLLESSDPRGDVHAIVQRIFNPRNKKQFGSYRDFV